jgi:hypothetical protein
LLTGHINQEEFIERIKYENRHRFEELGSHFNFVDDGYKTGLNFNKDKRP